MKTARETAEKHKAARQKRLLAALRSTGGGQISVACAKAKISRQSHYNWCESDLAYRQKYEQIVHNIHTKLEQAALTGIRTAAVRGHGPACVFIRKHFGQDALNQLLNGHELEG